jgi:hypothetical protein
MFPQIHQFAPKDNVDGQHAAGHALQKSRSCPSNEIQQKMIASSAIGQ